MNHTPRSINEIADQLGLGEQEIEPYGTRKAKLLPAAMEARSSRPDGRLVLMSGINPTPAGDGKTTTSIGLGQAFGRLGHSAAICLREPSLGPCFGMKGGATGGGKACLVPAEDINLHFTGDFHAITSAHNLLAATLDNHLHHGNRLDIEPRTLLWSRVLDMNDRALRRVVVGLGGRQHGVPRETSFDITAASEVMAILCLAENLAELKQRLGQIIVGYRRDKTPVRAEELGVTGAMAALLADAVKPNLVQTMEGTPALVHGGPFANIAHGCSSVIATRLALKCASIVITEAGFGFDLGGEKFLDIKCRKTGLRPDAVIIVATLRSLKLHGGVPRAKLAAQAPEALEQGLDNLAKHLENAESLGLPALVALNRFPDDEDGELKRALQLIRGLGVQAVVSDVYRGGGEAGRELAQALLELMEQETSQAAPLYPDDMSLKQKIETVARHIYGASGVRYSREAERDLDRVEALGLGGFPVCIAKTQYSLSDDPRLLGRAADFELRIRELRLAAGAGFVVPVAGDIMTMPGLPREPAAERMDVDASGRPTGV